MMVSEVPIKKFWKFLGGGGRSSKTPLEWKILGGGGRKSKSLPLGGGGYGYFLEPLIRLN